jgi:hypothetical protein
MRHLLSFSLAAVLVCSGHAADQIIAVTPQNLKGWTVTGAGKIAPVSGAQLVLPAGVQLSREFSGSAVILHLVTRPVFSDQAEDWPIIGLGSAALAFTRKDGQGHLVLVVGETTGTNLPWVVPLDPAGKLDPVELFLAYDSASGVGLIRFQDKVQSFDVPPNAKATEVWLSAGVPSDWPSDLMQVMLLDLNPDQTGAAGSLAAESSKLTPTDKLQAALDKARAKNNANSTNAAAGGALGGGGTAATAGTVSMLEVFTPPSVRRGQIISAVRSAVAKAQAK